MAVKKVERGKVVKEKVGNTYFDVHYVPTFEGFGKKRKTKTSTFAVFHTKHNLKSGFKNADEAERYAIAIFPSYNKKKHDFKDIHLDPLPNRKDRRKEAKKEMLNDKQ